MSRKCIIEDLQTYKAINRVTKDEQSNPEYRKLEPLLAQGYDIYYEEGPCISLVTARTAE